MAWTPPADAVSFGPPAPPAPPSAPGDPFAPGGQGWEPPEDSVEDRTEEFTQLVTDKNADPKPNQFDYRRANDIYKSFGDIGKASYEDYLKDLNDWEVRQPTEPKFNSPEEKQQYRDINFQSYATKRATEAPKLRDDFGVDINKYELDAGWTPEDAVRRIEHTLHPNFRTRWKFFLSPHRKFDIFPGKAPRQLTKTDISENQRLDDLAAVKKWKVEIEAWEAQHKPQGFDDDEYLDYLVGKTDFDLNVKPQIENKIRRRRAIVASVRIKQHGREAADQQFGTIDEQINAEVTDQDINNHMVEERDDRMAMIKHQEAYGWRGGRSGFAPLDAANRGIFNASNAAGAQGGRIVDTLFGTGGTAVSLADQMYDQGLLREAAASEGKGYWENTFSNVLPSIIDVVVLSKVAAGLKLAQWGRSLLMAGSFANSALSQGLYDADSEGVKGWEKYGSAGLSAIFEGGVMLAFNVIGRGGFEQMPGKMDPFRAAFRRSLRSGKYKKAVEAFANGAAKVLVPEAIEEAITTAGQQFAATLGPDPTATNYDNMVSSFWDTMAAVGITVGTMHGGSATADVGTAVTTDWAAQKKKLENLKKKPPASRRAKKKFRELERLQAIRTGKKKHVTAEEGEALGFTKEEMKNRESRNKALDNRIQKTEQDLAEAVQNLKDFKEKGEMPSPADRRYYKNQRRVAELNKAREKGYISSEEGKALGIEGDTRKKRLANVDAEIQKRGQEIEQADADAIVQEQVELDAAITEEWDKLPDDAKTQKDDDTPVLMHEMAADINRFHESQNAAPPVQGQAEAEVPVEGPLYRVGIQQIESAGPGDTVNPLREYDEDINGPALDEFGESLNVGDVIEDYTGLRYIVDKSGYLVLEDGEASIGQIRSRTKAEKEAGKSRSYRPDKSVRTILATSRRVEQETTPKKRRGRKDQVTEFAPAVLPAERPLDKKGKPISNARWKAMQTQALSQAKQKLKDAKNASGMSMSAKSKLVKAAALELQAVKDRMAEEAANDAIPAALQAPKDQQRARIATDEDLTDSEKQQVKILKKLGFDLRFIEGGNDTFPALFEGRTMWISRAYTQEWNKIWSEQGRSDESMTWGIFAHETFHGIRKKHPKEWKKFSKWLHKHDKKGVKKAEQDYLGDLEVGFTLNLQEDIKESGLKNVRIPPTASAAERLAIAEAAGVEISVITREAAGFLNEFTENPGGRNEVREDESVSRYLENRAGDFTFWDTLSAENPGLMKWMWQELQRRLRFGEASSMAGRVRHAMESAMANNGIAASDGRGRKAAAASQKSRSMHGEVNVVTTTHPDDHVTMRVELPDGSPVTRQSYEQLSDKTKTELGYLGTDWTPASRWGEELLELTKGRTAEDRGKRVSREFEEQEQRDRPAVGQQRRSQGYHPDEHVAASYAKKSTKYQHAPPRVKTLAALKTRLERLTALVQEGVEGRYWYEDSSEAILSAVGYDPATWGDLSAKEKAEIISDAEKIAALMAVYSPANRVYPNTSQAIKAYQRWKAGAPVHRPGETTVGRFEARDEDAIRVLEGNRSDGSDQWEGVKTNNFYVNLMVRIDPTLVQAATVDMWIMRVMGYTKDNPTPGEYKFAHDQLETIANSINEALPEGAEPWTIPQVQAAIWVAGKARWEMTWPAIANEAHAEGDLISEPDEEAKWQGLSEQEETDLREELVADGKTGPEINKKVKLEHTRARSKREKKYRAKAYREAMKLVAADVKKLKEAAFDFSTGIGLNTGVISIESQPTPASGVLPGSQNASYQQKLEFHVAMERVMRDTLGRNIILSELGLLQPAHFTGAGLWGTDVSPVEQIDFLITKSSEKSRIEVIKKRREDAGLPPLSAYQMKQRAINEKFHLDQPALDAINEAAALIGLIRAQDAVGWHRPFFTKHNEVAQQYANGVDVQLGRTITTKEMAALQRELDAAGYAGQYFVASTAGGARIIRNQESNAAELIEAELDLEGVNDKYAREVLGSINKEFRKTVRYILENEAVMEDNWKAVEFHAQSGLVSNNWEDNPNGEGYLERLRESRRSDVYRGLLGNIAPAVERVREDFSERYDWGEAGSVPRLTRGRAAVGRRPGFRTSVGGGRDGRGVRTGQTQKNDAAPKVTASAESYLEANRDRLGITDTPHDPLVNLDETRSKHIGQLFEDAPETDLANPEVRAAYDQMAQEVLAQYQHIIDNDGMTFTYGNDGYKNSEEMMADVADNNHMQVYLTDKDSFGSREVTHEHPLLEGTGIFQGEHELVYNDLFRAVHDYYGHAANGNQFGGVGEERAWAAHAVMFSPQARRAMTNETRGQNSWVNYGPQMFDKDGWRGDKNHPQYIKPSDRPYSDQKVILLPADISTPKFEGGRAAVGRQTPNTGRYPVTTSDSQFAPADSVPQEGEVVYQRDGEKVTEYRVMHRRRSDKPDTITVANRSGRYKTAPYTEFERMVDPSTKEGGGRAAVGRQTNPDIRYGVGRTKFTGIKREALERQADEAGIPHPSESESVNAVELVADAVANHTPESDELIQELAAQVINDRKAITVEETADLLASVEYHKSLAEASDDKAFEHRSNGREVAAANAEAEGVLHYAAMARAQQAARDVGRRQFAYMGHVLQVLVDKDGAAHIERELLKANLGERDIDADGNDVIAAYAKGFADAIAAAKKKKARRGKELVEKETELAADDQKEELQDEIKREATHAKKKRGERNRVVTKKNKDDAVARIRARIKSHMPGSGRLSANPVDVGLLLPDAAIVGAYLVESGVLKLAEFSQAMISELGDWVKPHLSHLHRDARAEYARVRQEELREKLADADDIHGQNQSVVQLAKEILAETRKPDGTFITRKELIDRIHAELHRIDDTITRRDAQDLFSKSKRTELSQEDLEVAYRNARGETREETRIDDLKNKVVPELTGQEQHTPSQEERELKREVTELKKKGEEEGWFQQGDQDAKVKGTLEARETRLKNEIADLDKQIDAGKKTVRKRKVPLTSPEIDALKAQRDAKKEQLDAIADPTGVESYLDVLDRQIAKLKQDLAKKSVFPVPKLLRPGGKRVDARKAELEALQAEKAEMRKILDPDYETNQRLLQAEKAAEREVAKLEQERAAGFPTQEAAEAQPDSPKLQAARAKLEKLRAERTAAHADEDAITAAGREVARLEAERVAGFPIKGKKPATTTRSPELLAARAKLAALRQERDEAQADARAILAAKRQIAKLQKEEAANFPLKGKPAAMPESPELKQAKEILDALQQRRKQAQADAVAIRAAEQQVEKLEEEKLAGWKIKQKAAQKPSSPELLEARAKRDALRDERMAVLGDEYARARSLAQKKRNIANIAARIASGDFAPRKRKPARTWNDAEWLQAQEEERAARKELAEEKARYEWENRTTLQTIGFGLKRGSIIWKAFSTAFDLGAAGIQLGVSMYTNPRIWAKAWIPTLKSVGKKQRERQDAEMEADPDFELFRDWGVALTKEDEGTEFYGHDEWIKRIPGLAVSERTFTTALNQVRFNLMKTQVAIYTKDGRTLTKDQGEALARQVNIFTMAYKPPKNARKRKALLDAAGLAFWAPSMYVARAQLFVGAPVIWDTGADSRVRKMAAIQYIKAMVGTAALIAALRMLLGDDDEEELTPVDTDYWKVKSGNIRMDMTSGMGQMAVLAARLLNGAWEARTGEAKWETKGRPRGARELFGSFASFKVNPWVGAFLDLISGTDAVGRPTTVANTFLSNLTPLSVQTVIEAVEEEGFAKGMAWSVPGVTGRNLSIYDPTSPKSEETFLATVRKLIRQTAGAETPPLSDSEYDKWYKGKAEWDTDWDAAAKFLSPEQVKEARTGKQQAVIEGTPTTRPEKHSGDDYDKFREDREDTQNWSKNIEGRLKALQTLEDMSKEVSAEKAQAMWTAWYENEHGIEKEKPTRRKTRKYGPPKMPRVPKPGAYRAKSKDNLKPGYKNKRDKLKQLYAGGFAAEKEWYIEEFANLPASEVEDHAARLKALREP